jgi:signal transduction histidine kinase
MTEEDELEALRQENLLLRRTLDFVDGTIVAYDSERCFVLANKAYYEFFPHLPPEKELVGQRYEAVLERSIEAGSVLDPQAHTDRAAFIASRIQVLERRDETPRETYDPRSGRWHLIRIRHTPDGARVSLRVDITEQKRLQQDLEKARDAAEQASQGKSRFLANMSHELRTPLNAVINFARLMAEQIHGPLGSPEYVEYARSIQDSGLDLLSLIERLLDLARADAGTLALSEQPVNLRALLDSAARQFRAQAEESRIELRTSIAPDLPTVLADKVRLRQILTSLLDNAVRYSGPGSEVELAARALPDHGPVVIEISDNGRGIAAEDLERLLLPFERADATARPGLGIGIPLANHLAHLHDGSLTIDSLPGRGTTVRVSLPAKRLLPAD